MYGIYEHKFGVHKETRKCVHDVRRNNWKFSSYEKYEPLRRRMDGKDMEVVREFVHLGLTVSLESEMKWRVGAGGVNERK